MELSANTFNSLPRTKSISIPILFIPFNNNVNCSYCRSKYSVTKFFNQRYCKCCLLSYIKYTIDIDPLVEYFKCNAIRSRCGEDYPIFCSSCHDYSSFEQIILTFYETFSSSTFERKHFILLRGKLIYQQMILSDLCSDCHRISFEGIKSTLTEETIPVLYLPWWDICDQCRGCDKSLELISPSQKWCQNCFIIYVGCRYCLTTNIIFGITSKSLCRKCERESFITFDFIDDVINMKEFLLTTKIKTNYNKIANYVYKDLSVCIRNKLKPQIKWIPYFQIENLAKIAEGGYGIIYSATLLGRTVAIKRLFNSQDISTHFLNEVKSLAQCYGPYITKILGITRDFNSKDCMLVMEYANGGNLHDYLHKNFTNISWNKKLYILWKISEGLNAIHKNHFIHRDFHSGNILLTTYQAWIIGDLGLSQPANNTLLNNELYGVIPYIAPEVFKGAKFLKESDIYSMGMIMWELTTGCKPFADVEHDTKLIYEIIDGKRPKITNDTPESFANLMKECWNFDPSKRPSMNQIVEIAYNWYKNKFANQFILAESKRLELIQSKELGPDFSKKLHSGAVFTSRSLASLISTTNLSSISMNREYTTNEYCLDINSVQSTQHHGTIYISESINSSSRILFNMRQEYISREYELDINKNQSLSFQITSNTHHPNAIYTSRPLSQLISTVNTSKKRNIEELEIEAQNDLDNGKHTKTE